LTPTVCDPKKLAELARNGDLAVLDQATRCYGDRLLAVARRHCRSEEEAQDAVQDAILSAGEHLGQYRGDGALASWLARMVAHACGRMRRGRKNDPALHAQDIDLPEDENGPEDEAARMELATALHDGLLGLNPTDRAIVLLADVDDWTGPEIAAEMGMTAGAVRTRLSRSRGRLREALRGHLGPSPLEALPRPIMG
jgi:RNA polymerase sigma-70 factor, ECF subfamily